MKTLGPLAQACFNAEGLVKTGFGKKRCSYRAVLRRRGVAGTLKVPQVKKDAAIERFLETL